jgi:hypothetical protein
VDIRGGHAPIAPPEPAEGATFTPDAIGRARPYGLGPRRWLWLPGGIVGGGGALGTLAFANTDPVGRLGIVIQGGIGEPATWRGASVRAEFRGLPIRLDATAFGVAEHPSRRGPLGDAVGAADAGTLANATLDARYAGGLVGASFDRPLGGERWSARLGVSAGRLDRDAAFDEGRRFVAFGEGGAGIVRSRGRRFVRASLALHGAAGSTAGDGWTRGVASGSLGAGAAGFSLRVEGTAGAVRRGESGAGPAPGPLDPDGGAYEEFVVGGSSSPFFDRALLSQRIALPAVPVGYARGSEVTMLRASLGGFALSPYALWLRAGDQPGRWQRLLGLEREWDFESFAVARLPGARFRVGVGHSLDEPFRRKTRVYLSAVYRP